jgi:hypothetical protein
MPVEHQQCDDEGSPDSSIRSSYFSRLSSSASPASMSAEFPICRALKRTAPSSLDETPISPGESPYSVDSTASSAISPISSTRLRSRNSVLTSRSCSSTNSATCRYSSMRNPSMADYKSTVGRARAIEAEITGF